VKVFLSWSGEPSRSVAKALHGWLGLVVQHVEPWMSDEEIKSGARWNETLARSLDEMDFGIVCVTRSNQGSPWLMFESGALAKRLEIARLVPLCIDLKPSEVTSPLQGFQGRPLTQAGMRQIIHDLHQTADRPRPREDIDRLFDNMWKELSEAVGRAKRTAIEEPAPSVRSTDDMLAELVTRVRNLERDIEQGRKADPAAAERERLSEAVNLLNNATARLGPVGDAIQTLRRVTENLESVVTRRPARPASHWVPDGYGRISGGEDFRVGDEVVHETLGTGIVLALDGDAVGRRVRVQFERETSWVDLKLAPMRRTGARRAP
jgi:hypothetical protein